MALDVLRYAIGEGYFSFAKDCILELRFRR